MPSCHELVAEPRLRVVRITSPNRRPPSRRAGRAVRRQAGKHIVSDKPLAFTSAECALLRQAAHQADISHVVTFNYRGNPLVQQMRQMVAAGELGSLVFLHGHSRQDWLTALMAILGV